jgi:hypothetical protein
VELTFFARYITSPIASALALLATGGDDQEEAQLGLLI